MAAVDFDLRFTYVLAGWEGTAHDALVLADALARERGLQVPQGKYYLVDAGYGAKPGFLPPFRNVRYHLNEWGSNPVQNAQELFNLRHSSLRVTVERAFASLKRRFKILSDATPFFTFPVQVDIVVACCVLHNYALSQGIEEFIIPENNKSDTPLLNTPIEHYRAMEFFFGSTTATGKYAKSGNDTFSIDLDEESELQTSPNVGESSAKAPPKKKAKVVHIEDDPLVTTLKDGFKIMADALMKSGGDNEAIPDGLWDALAAIKGFDDSHIAHYYAHLVDSPKIANAFMTLSLDNKLVWVTRYVEKTFGVFYNLK
ncbi:hypothetical protein ACQ4PT_037771 [Festuca glaucescens]